MAAHSHQCMITRLTAGFMPLGSALSLHYLARLLLREGSTLSQPFLSQGESPGRAQHQMSAGWVQKGRAWHSNRPLEVGSASAPLRVQRQLSHQHENGGNHLRTRKRHATRLEGARDSGHCLSPPPENLTRLRLLKRVLIQGQEIIKERS